MDRDQRRANLPATASRSKPALRAGFVAALKSRATASTGVRLLLSIAALFERHAQDRALRRAVMGTHIVAGMAHEHAASVDLFLHELGESERFEGVSMLQATVATQAVLGIARSITDAACEYSKVELVKMVDETANLVGNYLKNRAG